MLFFNKTFTLFSKLLFLFFILNTFLAFFYPKKIFSQPKNKQDSLFINTQKKDSVPPIESFYDNICLTTAVISRDFNISLQHPNQIKNTNIPTADYNTILPVSFGLALDYKWLSLEYSLALPLNEQPSWQRSFRTGITGKKIWAKTFWQEYRGLSNESIDSLPIPNKNTFRQDIYAQMFYFRVMYAFNRKSYSHLASLFQVDRQTKSAGTWALGVSYTKNYVEGDSALVFYERDATKKNPLDIKRVGSGFISLQGGYAHTFVLKQKWFWHISLFPALSVQKNHVRYMNGQTQMFDRVFGFNNEFQTAIGYNDDRFFAGLKLQNLSFVDNLDKDGFYTYSFTQLRLFAGFRLNKKYKLFF